MHRGGRKFKLFSAASGFKGQIFTEELSEVDSAGALRQGISMFLHYSQLPYTSSYIFFN